jgi:hypothetical protein
MEPGLIEDHHPAYISFEKYLKIQELMENNTPMKAAADNKAGPAREGEALLQGLVRCGRCGRRFMSAKDKDKRFKRGAESTSGLCRVFRLLECRIKPVPFRQCARDGNLFCRPGGFFSRRATAIAVPP